ncbi:response regulator transcription factor [Vallitalea maricola]|uniref:Response regulator transcription factor n=1 Tax=Vallitalea maricola TaxID=3074433 RepID=A0ACB5UQ40_9FIRM|nr:response regulator transcription factor [Vallitalea sp. AN17-2]
MYKVLLVDDDFPVRVLLKQMINWEEAGLEIVGEAIDGEEALEKINELNPDIAIVDIGMPIKNGVDLIKELKEQNSRCKVIVLSCHDDFQYVKEALKFGAKEYILKNLVTEERLLVVLNQMKVEIDKEKVEIQESQQLKRWANRGMWELKQEYLQQILRGIIINKNKIEQLIDELSINISRYSNVLLLVEIDNYEDVINKIADRHNKKLFNFSVRNVLEEVLLGIAEGEVVDLGGKHIAIIVSFENEKSELVIIEKLNTLSHKIRDSINRYFDVNISTVITEKTNKLLDLFNLYEKALITILIKFYNGGNKIYWTSDSKTITNNSQSINVKNLEKLIRKYVKESNMLKLEELIDGILAQAKTKRISPNKVIKFWLKIHIILEKICENYDIEMKQLTDGSLTKKIQKSETIFELKEIIMVVVKDIAHYFKSETKETTISHEIVKEIINYVSCNYMKDITLSMVAERVNMNMAYISHLFKQEVGESFVDFLKTTRIKKAKYLLEHTDETVNSIANKVGFTDRKYFSKIFKKVEGVNPTEYKKRIV